MEASAVKRDWLPFSPSFRAIRAKSRKKMTSCDWCKHPFVDGEMMALAIANGGNKCLCQKCADELTESAVIP